MQLRACIFTEKQKKNLVRKNPKVLKKYILGKGIGLKYIESVGCVALVCSSCHCMSIVQALLAVS